ncbi:uncharacterized protein LOC125673237 [Ostrea edulis]|uniref:uncharacterized protein LOC125673237 n=1 Tax=Ostrea edulis TaxID=37623 RepID=UPI0024AECBC6|nr:uncharacterized protein LOC125673237 [Ostrea edulis]
MNGNSYFKQLKQLCRTVEQGLQEVTDEVENNYSHRGSAAAVKKMVDLKTDVKDMRNQGKELLQTLEIEGEKFDKILKISRQYLEVYKQSVQRTEEYYTKYGYQKPVLETNSKQEEKVGEPVEEEESKPIEDQDTAETNKTPQKEKSLTDLPRTPKPEDFGLSSLVLSAYKRPEKTQVFSFLEVSANRNKLDSVPDVFQHDGIQVSPGFLSCKRTTPGWKQYGMDKQFLVPKLQDGVFRKVDKENFDSSNNPAPRFTVMADGIGKDLSDITGIQRLPNTPELASTRVHSHLHRLPSTTKTQINHQTPPDTPQMTSKLQLNHQAPPDTREVTHGMMYIDHRPSPGSPKLSSTKAWSTNRTPEMPTFLKKYKMTEPCFASPVSKLWKSPTIPQQPEHQSHMEAFHEMPKVPKLKGMFGLHN